MRRWLILCLLCMGGYGFAQTVQVAAEEDVYTFVNPDNGSGPLWGYGCTPVARLGNRVFVAQMETGEGVPLLSNTRWKLLERQSGQWKVIAEEAGYRQREPSSLAHITDNELLLNVNESICPPGTKYGPAEPYLLKFSFPESGLQQTKLVPSWIGKPTFTDHSYRGFAADPARGQILMLNIDATTGVENACLLSNTGKTLANDVIEFPIRSCYPQVQLSNGAAYVLAISDIVEPVEAWKKYKFEQTQRTWDYVFRILYFTWTPNLQEKPFAKPVEIANVDATGGAISNKDLWVNPAGEAFIMYTECEVQSTLLRDKFFPGKSVISSLKLAQVKEGVVTNRRTLIEGSEQRSFGDARFHLSPEGTLYAVVYVSGPEAGNKLIAINPDGTAGLLIPIPMKKPIGSFALASMRAGNTPSKTIDLLGQRDGTTLSYAQLVIQ